jgi:hypothetical protein
MKWSCLKVAAACAKCLGYTCPDDSLLIVLGQAIGATPCGGALAVEGAREAVLVRAIFRDNSVAVSRLCRSIRAAHVSDIVLVLAQRLAMRRWRALTGGAALYAYCLVLFN